MNTSTLKAPLLKILSKTFAPDTLIEQKFGRYDLAFKTDDKGNPILLFLGVKDDNGKIKGDRYARRLVHDASGKLVKDHWDRKGPATAQL